MRITYLLFIIHLRGIDMYFSEETQGFYVGDQYDVDAMPKDCIEVDEKTEYRIRELIIAGNIISVSDSELSTQPINPG